MKWMRSTHVDDVDGGVLDEILIRPHPIAPIEMFCEVKRFVERAGADSHDSLPRVSDKRFDKRGRDTAQPHNSPPQSGGVQRRFGARDRNDKGLIKHHDPSNTSLLAVAIPSRAKPCTSGAQSLGSSDDFSLDVSWGKLRLEFTNILR